MSIALIALREVVGKIRLLIYFYVLLLLGYYRKEPSLVAYGQFSSRNKKIKGSSDVST